MNLTMLFIGGIGMQEVLLAALIVLLFFGGEKIPELMRGTGKGMGCGGTSPHYKTRDRRDQKRREE